MNESELKRFLSAMTFHVNDLCENDNMNVGTMHDDDSTFIIVEDWQTIYKLNTYLAIEANCDYLYSHAIESASDNDKHQGRLRINPGPTPELFSDDYIDNGRTYNLIDDLRLGTDKRYPDSSYNTPFIIPEPLNDYVEKFWEVYGDYGFSDEYSQCAACDKIIKTSPDSYSWSPDYIIDDYEGYIHVNCLDIDDVLESHKNRNKALPHKIQDLAIKDNKLVELSDIKFENGMHSGMNDDPKIIIRTFKKAKIDVWFNVNPSQFYVEFNVLVRPDDELVSREILSHLDVYQGYDNADEMSKALSGKHSDYIHVETRTISQKDFIEGKM